MEKSRQRALTRLEKALGTDVIAVAWAVAETHGLDPNRATARVAQRCATAPRRKPAVTLFVSGQGGCASFADYTIRALRSLYERVDVIVASDVAGAGTLLALGADTCFIAGAGALGAYDSGPRLPGPARLTPREFNDVPAMGGVDLESEPGLQGRLAFHRHESRIARNLAERWLGEDRRSLFVSLSAHDLGDSTAIGPEELDDSRIVRASDEVADAATKAQEIYDFLLRIDGDDTLVQYTADGLGDEVEFEAAMDIPVACVESVRFSSVFLVDSGRPHPETRLYVGRWTK